MKQPLITPQLIIFAVLFIIATISFSLISSYGYFEPSPTATHIIDAHLMPEKTDGSLHVYSKRFFDGAYVREAAKQYCPRKYLSSYYLLDFLFPIIYLNFFLTLAGYWKGTTFYTIFRWAMFAVLILDLSENTSFAYYLFHQEGNLNRYVAIFTTLKSVLFFLGLFTAIIAFGAAGVSQFKKIVPID